MIHLQETAVLRSSKKILLSLSFMLCSALSFACEICGCSINGYHFGILPQFKQNFIGVRYSYRSFESQHLISEQLHILGNKSTEFFNSAELWGRFYVGKKIQVFAFVPFNHYMQNEMGNKTTASGIGDITLAANYTLYNDATNKDKKFKETLLAGGGIKLPTGKFETGKSGGELNPSMNTGTGSVDYLANVIYTCRYKRIGLNMDVNYRLNTTNSDAFKYGDRLTSSAKFFYWKDLGKKTSVLPNVGLLYEHAQLDQHYQEKQFYSGGNITFLTAGVEAYYSGKINVGATYNHPISQDMFQGLVKTKDNVSVNVSYIF